MKRRAWTTADDDALRKGVADGIRLRLIGEALGRTHAAAVKRAEKIGVKVLPEAREANRLAALREVTSDPGFRERQRAGCLNSWKGNTARRDNARRQALERNAMGHLHQQLANDPEKEAARRERARQQQRAYAEKRMAWCPPAYRKSYLYMMVRYGAAAARQATELDIARDRQKALEAERVEKRGLSFEQRLERVRRGEVQLIDLDAIQPRHMALAERDQVPG